MFGKKGKEGHIFYLLVALVVILVIGPAKVQNWVGGLLGINPVVVPPVTSIPSVPSTPSGTCVDPTVKVSMTLSSADYYAPGTVPGGDNRVWIDGADQGLVANANSLTVSPGSSYVILWVDNSTSYYGKVTKGVVPCAGTLKPFEKLYAWSNNIPASTFANVWNEKGQVGDPTQVASGTYFNITMNAGDQYQVNFELKGQYKKAIGNPSIDADEGKYYNTIGCRYNNTAFTSDGVVIALSNAEKSEVTGCPSTLATSAAGYSWTCVSAPSIVSNGKLSGTLTLTADATNAPTADADDIQCYYWDADYARHSITNEIIKGGVDNINTNLGMGGNLNFTFQIQ